MLCHSGDPVRPLTPRLGVLGPSFLSPQAPWFPGWLQEEATWWLPPYPSCSLPRKWVSQQLRGLREAMSAKAAVCVSSRGLFWQHECRTEAAHDRNYPKSDKAWRRPFPLCPLSTARVFQGCPCPRQAQWGEPTCYREPVGCIASLCLLLTVRLWPTYLISLCLSFFFSKMG